jgi:hypothetical protein
MTYFYAGEITRDDGSSASCCGVLEAGEGSHAEVLLEITKRVGEEHEGKFHINAFNVLPPIPQHDGMGEALKQNWFAQVPFPDVRKPNDSDDETWHFNESNRSSEPMKLFEYDEDCEICRGIGTVLSNGELKQCDCAAPWNPPTT